MKSIDHIATILLCVSLLGCSTAQRQSQARQELDSSVDDLCRWTGMNRSGPLTAFKRWPTDDPRYTVTTQLNIDGSVRPFTVGFDSRRHVRSFTPEPFDLSNMSHGLGYDTVKDPKTRARCIAAVNKLNQYLQWTSYGRPAIQKVGSDFIVTYETVSPAESKKNMYLDPFVSFLITPQGTVFATFFGA